MKYVPVFCVKFRMWHPMHVDYLRATHTWSTVQ